MPALPAKNGFFGSPVFRVLVTALALAVWFWTQSLIGARPAPVGQIGDGLHRLTAPVNAYFGHHPRAANLLLVASSMIVDLLAIFLLGSWLAGRGVRTFLGLFLLLALRQVLQALVALPPPAGMIWHNPGVPSLLVTYSVAGDFFFSGHTAIAVFGAIELARLGRRWLAVVAFLVALFEIAAVLVLRAHYTMDVFTGILAALWVASVVGQLAPRLDRRMRRA